MRCGPLCPRHVRQRAAGRAHRSHRPTDPCRLAPVRPAWGRAALPGVGPAHRQQRSQAGPVMGREKWHRRDGSDEAEQRRLGHDGTDAPQRVGSAQRPGRARDLGSWQHRAAGGGQVGQPLDRRHAYATRRQPRAGPVAVRYRPLVDAHARQRAAGRQRRHVAADRARPGERQAARGAGTRGRWLTSAAVTTWPLRRRGSICRMLAKRSWQSRRRARLAGSGCKTALTGIALEIRSRRVAARQVQAAAGSRSVGVAHLVGR